MLQLQITNIHGMIGINKNDSVLSISQPQADLNITTTPAELNTHNSFPQVRIDQSQCFSEAGLKDIFELTEEYAQRGMAAAVEAVGEIAQNGDMMAHIESKRDPFAAIAANKALAPPADSNITLMPVSRPKIDFVGGVSFNPEMGHVNIDVRVNHPEVEATYPSTDIYMQQKAYFHFEFVGNNVDVNA